MKKILILLFITDRILKFVAPRINLGDGFLRIGLYKNYAGAFSLPIAGTLYNIAGIILIIIFGYLLMKTTSYKLQAISYIFIILGGASNLFDRLYFGYVIDYIQVSGRSFFNIADVMLIAGIVTLLIKNFKIKNSLKIEN